MRNGYRERYCGRCHTCGATLTSYLDGEEWCPKCQQYRRYESHGWGWSMGGERGEFCPDTIGENVGKVQHAG